MLIQSVTFFFHKLPIVSESSFLALPETGFILPFLCQPTSIKPSLFLWSSFTDIENNQPSCFPAGQPAQVVALHNAIIFSASQRRFNSVFKFNRIPGGGGGGEGSKGWMKRGRKYLASPFGPISCILPNFSTIINPRGFSNTSPRCAAHSAPARTGNGGREGKAGLCRQGWLSPEEETSVPTQQN